MGATFDQGEAEKARYWYQKKVYTYGPISLPTGTTTIFTAQQWNDRQFPEWLARLTRVAMTQNPGVSISYLYDNQTGSKTSNMGFTDAAPADLQWLEVDAPAVSFLQLTITNNSGAAIPNFNANYEVEMQRLTAADKLMLGYALSPQDTANLTTPNGPTIQDVQNAVSKGKRPLSIAAQIALQLENCNRGEDQQISGTYHVTANASTTQSQSFASATVENGFFDVVEQIAVPTMAAITLYANIDNQSSALQVNGAAFAQASPAYPWRVFMPALASINFSVSAASTLTAVPVQILVRRYKMSDLWKVRLEIAKSAGAVPGKTFVDVWSGLA